MKTRHSSRRGAALAYAVILLSLTALFTLRAYDLLRQWQNGATRSQQQAEVLVLAESAIEAVRMQAPQTKMLEGELWRLPEQRLGSGMIMASAERTAAGWRVLAAGFLPSREQPRSQMWMEAELDRNGRIQTKRMTGPRPAARWAVSPMPEPAASSSAAAPTVGPAAAAPSPSAQSAVLAEKTQPPAMQTPAPPVEAAAATESSPSPPSQAPAAAIMPPGTPPAAPETEARP